MLIYQSVFDWFYVVFSTYKLPGLALCSDVQSMDYRVFQPLAEPSASKLEFAWLSGRHVFYVDVKARRYVIPFESRPYGFFCRNNLYLL